LTNISERMVRGIVSDDAGTINQLSQSLLDVKSEFYLGLAVQTIFVSFPIPTGVTRIQEVVDAIGKFWFSYV